MECMLLSWISHERAFIALWRAHAHQRNASMQVAPHSESRAATGRVGVNQTKRVYLVLLRARPQALPRLIVCRTRRLYPFGNPIFFCAEK
jgi:hypothetical protein